jgi:hypothetical protein
MLRLPCLFVRSARYQYRADSEKEGVVIKLNSVASGRQLTQIFFGVNSCMTSYRCQLTASFHLTVPICDYAGYVWRGQPHGPRL